MKAGIELIAEKQKGMTEIDEGWVWSVQQLVVRANMSIVFQTRPSQKDEAIRLLAEAGALIAAEIDRLNNIKQE